MQLNQINNFIFFIYRDITIIKPEWPDFYAIKPCVGRQLF